MLVLPSAYVQGPLALVHDNTVTHRHHCNSPLTVVPAQGGPAEADSGAGPSSDGVPPRLFSWEELQLRPRQSQGTAGPGSAELSGSLSPHSSPSSRAGLLARPFCWPTF